MKYFLNIVLLSRMTDWKQGVHEAVPWWFLSLQTAGWQTLPSHTHTAGEDVPQLDNLLKHFQDCHGLSIQCGSCGESEWVQGLLGGDGNVEATALCGRSLDTDFQGQKELKIGCSHQLR